MENPVEASGPAKGLGPSNNWDVSQYEDLGQFVLAWIDTLLCRVDIQSVTWSVKFLEQAMSDQTIIESLMSDFAKFDMQHEYPQRFPRQHFVHFPIQANKTLGILLVLQ